MVATTIDLSEADTNIPDHSPTPGYATLRQGLSTNDLSEVGLRIPFSYLRLCFAPPEVHHRTHTTGAP